MTPRELTAYRLDRITAVMEQLVTETRLPAVLDLLTVLLSQVGVHLITSLVPAFISGVPCVSSGELISDCNPPGGCQLSRIPGRRG